MKTFFKFSLEYKNILKEVQRFAKARKIKLYLVGGILRDLALGRRKPNPDFDFAVKRGAISFGRALARKMRAGFVVLDKGHGACRVVKKTDGGFYTLDFTDFRGKSIAEDLAHRDFTINALALELGREPLLDPCGAKTDLKKKVIRAVNKKSFSEDPLRILRAFSFASILGFQIVKETLKSAKAERKKLARVSGERIRDELFKIFESQDASDFLSALDKLKILKIIFPEIEKMCGIGQGPYHHLDVWQHTLETVKQLEILIQELKNNADIRDYLQEIISSERSRLALIKLGAFLHDFGKPAALRHKDGKTIFHGHERIGRELTENICKRLKLSNEEINSLKTIVLWHLRPGYLADNTILTPRAKFRFFRDCRREAISVLLISLADQRATKGPLTTRDSRLRHEKVVASLIKEYFKKAKVKKIARIVDGHQIMRKFNLRPSPLIGKILAEIEELRAIGKVKNKAEAFKAAQKLI